MAKLPTGITTVNITSAVQNVTTGLPVVYSQDVQGGFTTTENVNTLLNLTAMQLQDGQIVYVQNTANVTNSNPAITVDAGYYQFVQAGTGSTPNMLIRDANTGAFNAAHTVNNWLGLDLSPGSTADIAHIFTGNGDPTPLDGTTQADSTSRPLVNTDLTVGDLYINTGSNANTVWVLTNLGDTNITGNTNPNYRTWERVRTAAQFTLDDIQAPTTRTNASTIYWNPTVNNADGTVGDWQVVDLGVGDNLQWTVDDTAGTATLTGFTKLDGETETVRNTEFISNPNNLQGENNMLLRLTFATFMPRLFASTANSALAWDEPWMSSYAVRAGVENPDDITNRFISGVDDVRYDGTTLTGFTAGPATDTSGQPVTPGDGIDFFQDITGLSPVFATAGNNGSTHTFRVDFNQTTNGTESEYVGVGTDASVDITWSGIGTNFPARSVNLPSPFFWNSYGEIDVNQTIPASVIRNESTIDEVAMIQTGSIFDAANLAARTRNAQSAPDTRQDYNEPAQGAARLYKDTPWSSATLSVRTRLTRPAGVSGTTAEAQTTVTRPVTLLNSGSFRTPNLWLRTTNAAAQLSPNSTGANDLPILMGTFQDNANNGMQLVSGVNQWSNSNFGRTNGDTVTVPVGGEYFFFGWLGSNAPVAYLEQTPGSNVFNPVDFTTSITVDFNVANLNGAATPAGVPAGWTNVQYTFVRFLLTTAGTNRISLRTS